jgi:hypothetical protein
MDVEINDVVITLDTDWAPDFAIRKTADILIENQVKATWFLTHDSKAIRTLFEHRDLFELGIHPNFMPGSTQGDSYNDIMNYLMNIVPKAKAVRTHAMFYSASLSRMFAFDYGLETDSSIFLAEMPHITPYEVFYGDKKLIRMPYFWSDDGEMSIMQSPSFEFNIKKYERPGLKILDFHPIHVFLNSENIGNYSLLKTKVDFKDCTAESIKSFIHHGNGAGSLLREIIKNNPNPERFRTIAEIADEWKFLSHKIVNNSQL